MFKLETIKYFGVEPLTQKQETEMEELNKHNFNDQEFDQELEALFRQEEPKQKMPHSEKWRMRWSNTRTTLRYKFNEQRFSNFRISLPQLTPMLVPLIVLFGVFSILPNSVSLNNTNSVSVETHEETSEAQQSSYTVVDNNDPFGAFQCTLCESVLRQVPVHKSNDPFSWTDPNMNI